MPIDDFLTWFMTGFTLLFGLYLILQRRWAGVQALRVPVECNEDLSLRVRAVAEARAAVRVTPSALPYVNGGIWIVLSPLVAGHLVAPALAYGIGCFGSAACLVFAYVRGRKSGGRRAAMLSPRKIGPRIPTIWYALAALAAAAVLAFASVPALLVAAVLVALSTLATAALTIVAYTGPTTLFGSDLPVEQLVDNRVRYMVACATMTLAFVQPFVFCAFASALAHIPLAIATVNLTLVLAIGYSAWSIFTTRVPVRVRDLVTVSPEG